MALPPPPETLLEWSQIFAGLGTVVLTVFLVVLYKRQQEQLAANHEAILEVTDVEWDDDDATIQLSNYGNGVAKRIGLTTLVYVDSGGHRRYVAKTNMMKRTDKSGEWSNIIEPGEEEIEFTGTSRVGRFIPDRGFSGVKFSSFVRHMKENGASEIKYVHIVKGVELSGNACFDTVYWGTRAVNPQQFKREHSLENLPTEKIISNDTTFRPYLYPSLPLRLQRAFYVRGMVIANWLVPKIIIEPRSLDASGRKRVKRVALRYKIRKLSQRIRDKVLNKPNESD